MKIHIAQIGNAISVYDNRATATYPIEQFDELLAAMQLARADYGEPTENYKTLFENDEYRQHEERYTRRPPAVQQVKDTIDWDSLLSDVSAGLTTQEGKSESEDHTAINSDINF